MKDSSPHLAPRLETAEPILASLADVTSAITGHCNTLLDTTIQPAAGPPEETNSALSARLATAQRHGLDWITDLGPALASGATQTLVDYGDSFRAVTGSVLGLLEASANHPTPDQVREIRQLVEALLGEVGMQRQALQDLRDRLHGFAADVCADHADILRRTRSASGEAREVEGILASLDGLVTQEEAAEGTLTAFLDLWRAVEDELLETIVALPVGRDDLVPALRALDMPGAQDRWAQLARLASEMRKAAEARGAADPGPHPPSAGRPTSGRAA